MWGHNHLLACYSCCVGLSFSSKWILLVHMVGLIPLRFDNVQPMAIQCFLRTLTSVHCSLSLSLAKMTTSYFFSWSKKEYLSPLGKGFPTSKGGNYLHLSLGSKRSYFLNTKLSFRVWLGLNRQLSSIHFTEYGGDLGNMVVKVIEWLSCWAWKANWA